MTDHHAACSCGQLRLTARGEPVRVSMCHCLACQRRTGSTYGAQARFPADCVETAGTATEFSRVGDEGYTAVFSFCPHCGATVWYRFVDQPELVAVPVGAFADPSFPAPAHSHHEGRRHAWVTVPPGAERED